MMRRFLTLAVAASCVLIDSQTGALPPIVNGVERLGVLLGLPASTRATFAETTGASSYRNIVRYALGKDATFSTILPEMFEGMQKHKTISLVPQILKHTGASESPVYYLAVSCNAKQAIKVHPWWALATTVLVCPDAYKPDVLSEPSHSGKATHFCEATHSVDHTGTCGCGPYLLFCARDEDQAEKIERAVWYEAIDTVRYVIQNHRPFTDILRMNETVRSDYAELLYARSAWFTDQKFVFPTTLVESSSLRTRREPFEGGLVSTWQYRYYDEAPRINVLLLTYDFLGTALVSRQVSTGPLFAALSDPNLRAHGHIALADTTGCRDCHARLEYGMRAFSNFLGPRDGLHVDNRSSDGLARLYVRDASDLRAEGPATPKWYAEIISKQPEFSAEMMRKVERFILRGRSIDAPLRQKILERFRTDDDFARLLEDVSVAAFGGRDP
jgi:hypothetical protein